MSNFYSKQSCLLQLKQKKASPQALLEMLEIQQKYKETLYQLEFQMYQQCSIL